MQITTPLSEQIGRYLDLSSYQLKLTAENMANVDTPRYRTKGFDFASEMQRSLSEPLDAQSAGNVSSITPAVHEVDGLLERFPDGNNVSMDREGLQMAEAQLRFRTGIELLRQEFARVQSAIQVGRQIGHRDSEREEGCKNVNLFGVMEVSGSAMKAERIRAEVVAANMANAETTRTVDGGPYRRQHVVFAEAQSRGFANEFSAQGGAPLSAIAMSGAGSSTNVPGAGWEAARLWYRILNQLSGATTRNIRMPIRMAMCFTPISTR